MVVLADVAITLAYREPLSSIYGSIEQGRAADELKEIEAAYPGAGERRAIAGIRGERRRIAILARLFRLGAVDGHPVGRIRVPGMEGLDAVVVQGTDTADLRKGPGHYPQTEFPGEGGTVGIAGHRTTYLAPFRHIDSLERGDRIILEMPYATLAYRVERTAVVDPHAVGIVRDVGYERLVLSACHPLYSAAERFVVFARLVRERLAARVLGGRASIRSG